MDLDRQEQVISKLDSAYPDASDWIFDRADAISEKRLKESERVAFNRGVNAALAPLTLTFWKQDFEGAGKIERHYTKPKTDAISESWKAVGDYFDKAFDNNLRLAMGEYIKEKKVPLDIFTADEQIHLFGETASSFADDYKPQAGI